MRHTPEPWRAERNGDWWDVVSDDDNAIDPIALVARERDVALIEAAPKLLRALKRLALSFDDDELFKRKALELVERVESGQCLIVVETNDDN